jgi:tetratricopeptide (TPR) repeat protein
MPGFSPKICLAGAESIFEGNKDSVVILFSYDKEGREIDHATGFILSSDGAVITNYHCISNAAEIKMQTEDAMLEVKGILHIDKDNDIAVLKVNGKQLSAVKIRANGLGPEKQKIFMIGSPGGKEKILFEGTLSSIRNITTDRKLLLMTAPVTKGSSGSPVFNENGEVIGIATFFLEEDQAYSFAVPVEQIKNKLSLKKITPLNRTGLIDPEKTAEHWFNAGAAYESLGLYIYASGAYQKSIEIDPKNAIAHNNLGVVYTSLAIYSFAITEFTEAIRLKPDYQEAYGNLGIAYIKSDKTEKAAETFEEAIRLKPDDVKSYNNLAVAFFNSGKLKEAAEAAKQAILIKPDHPESYYNLGAVYSRMNMYAEAADALKQFIRLKPDIPEVHLRLGIIYSMQDTESALKEYEILKNLDPESAKLLQQIFQAKGSISYKAAGPSPRQNNDLPLQIADASVKDPVLSDKNDSPEDNSNPETTGKSDQIPGKNMYSVQVSFFADENNALSMVQRLRKKGYNAFLKMEYRVDQNIRYRVLVGRFAEKSEAEKQAQIIFNKEKLKSIIFKH